MKHAPVYKPDFQQYNCENCITFHSVVFEWFVDNHTDKQIRFLKKYSLLLLALWSDVILFLLKFLLFCKRINNYMTYVVICDINKNSNAQFTTSYGIVINNKIIHKYTLTDLSRLQIIHVNSLNKYHRQISWFEYLLLLNMFSTKVHWR